MITENDIKKHFRRCTTLEEVHDTAAELTRMGVDLHPYCSYLSLRAGCDDKIVFIADVDIIQTDKQRNCSTGPSTKSLIVKDKRVQVRFDGVNLIVTTEKISEIPPLGKYLGGMVRCSEHVVTPEPIFTNIEIAQENFVRFCIGNIAFSQETIEKIGFDPIEIITRQSSKIEELTRLQHSMSEELQELKEDVFAKHKELLEARKPLYKKIFSFVFRSK